MTAILDTNFLYALTDQDDQNHERVLRSIQDIDEKLILPVAVLPETCYLIASRLGHQLMRQFVSSMAVSEIQIEPTTSKDLERIHQLLEQYADNRLDFADAAIVSIAERLNVTRIFTLDRRDFSIIRPLHCDYFELLP